MQYGYSTLPPSSVCSRQYVPRNVEERGKREARYRKDYAKGSKGNLSPNYPNSFKFRGMLARKAKSRSPFSMLARRSRRSPDVAARSPTGFRA